MGVPLLVRILLNHFSCFLVLAEHKYLSGKQNVIPIAYIQLALRPESPGSFDNGVTQVHHFLDCRQPGAVIAFNFIKLVFGHVFDDLFLLKNLPPRDRTYSE